MANLGLKQLFQKKGGLKAVMQSQTQLASGGGIL